MKSFSDIPESLRIQIYQTEDNFPNHSREVQYKSLPMTIYSRILAGTVLTKEITISRRFRGNPYMAALHLKLLAKRRKSMRSYFQTNWLNLFWNHEFRGFKSPYFAKHDTAGNERKIFCSFVELRWDLLTDQQNLASSSLRYHKVASTWHKRNSQLSPRWFGSS